MMQQWINQRILSISNLSAHTPALGMARSLLASGTLLALLATPTPHLFYLSPARPNGIICDGLARHISLFCILPVTYLEVAQLLAIVILLLVTIGLWPRITSLPHWWVAFSFYSSSNVMDGGDQVAAVITLLLLPVCLTDPRRWHWSKIPKREKLTFKVISQLGLIAIWIQISVVYLQASIGKLAVQEWRDGSAFWYWAMFPPFGVPDYVRPLLAPLLSEGPVVLGITWGTIAVEFFLSWSLVASHTWRKIAFLSGIALHASIAVFIGLPGFSLIMISALTLYLIRPGDPPLFNSNEFEMATTEKSAI